MLKSMGKILRVKKTHLHSFKVSSHKILINFKGEICKLIAEKLGTQYLIHVIKVNLIPCYEALRRAQHHFWGTLNLIL